MSAANDVARYLQDNSHGTLASDLFINVMVDRPDNVIVVYDTGGFPSDFAVGGAICFEKPSVQVAVRNTNPVTAESKCKDVHKLLDGGMKDQTPIDTKYYLAKATQTPFKLKEDELERHIYVFNVDLVRDQPA